MTNINDLDLKKLQQLIDLCHKNNIMEIEVDGIKLHLGAKPIKATRKRKQPTEVVVTDPLTGLQETLPISQVAESIATDELSADQLLYYSAGGN